jgi:serine/threonine-protein kinase RsbW
MVEARDPQPAGSFRLETRAGLSSLAAIRDFVADACRRLDAPPGAIAGLVQAVDEAATNVMLHGYEGFPGPVEITVRRDGDRLAATIRDEAPPFDPNDVPPPDLAEVRRTPSAGGLGVHLMRSLTDAMLYRRLPGGGNELTLVKSLSAAPPAATSSR